MKKSILTAALTLPLALVAAQKPNVVFILVDDLGYSDLAFMGQKELNTPNVDKFREQGMFFDNAYAACPVSSPTRASIITGKYPAEVKITCHIPGVGMEAYNKNMAPGRKFGEAYFTDHLDLDSPTVAKVMKSKGYKTAFMGKWHLAGSGYTKSADGVIKPEYHPDKFGFDVNLGGCSGGQPKSYFSPYKNGTLSDGKPGEYLTDRLGDEAVKYIKENKKDPFFLYLSFYAVHSPYQVPKDVVAQNKGNKYHALIQKMDENVGKILDCLNQEGLDENTLVIFYSDNGGLQANPPLSGKKGELREGGIRVPLICRWTGKIEAGSTNHTPITSVDMMPTLKDLTGTKLKKEIGESFLPLLLGKSKELKERAIFWHYPHHRKGSTWSMGAAVRKGDWKLIELYETSEVKLFNLKDDIKEDKDLSASNKAKTKELLDALHAWQKSVDAEPAKKLM
ncbi:MAG: sulfatase [Rikenellaceae bacterium]